MHYNMCVYQIQGHKTVASQSLNLHLGTSAREFGHNVWSKPSSLGSTTVKVVLFYPLCHNIIVFFLPFFTTQPAFNFDLEAQLHCLSQPSQLAVQLRQRVASAGPVQSHGRFGDG